MKDVRLEIYSQSFTIRSGLEPAYLEQLAARVDERMRALAAQTDTVDTRRLAVLVALNFADELHQLEAQLTDRQGELARAVAERVGAANQRLAAALAAEPRS